MRTRPLTSPTCRQDGHGQLMGALMGLIDSLEFSVLGEPTPEHAEALANVPGAHFYSGFASK